MHSYKKLATFCHTTDVAIFFSILTQHKYLSFFFFADNDCMAMIWVKKHMWLRWIRNFSPRSLLLLYVFLVIVVNEYLVFWVQSWRWPSLPDHNRYEDRKYIYKNLVLLVNVLIHPTVRLCINFLFQVLKTFIAAE